MGALVILCGKTEQIGQGVIATLKPEQDVIHFVTSPASGAVLGNKDYSRPPVAVILGAAFDDDQTEVMMKAAADIKPIPWLRPDLTKTTLPIGPEYGKALVARIKVLLAQLEKEGKMNEKKAQWY